VFRIIVSAIVIHWTFAFVISSITKRYYPWTTSSKPLELMLSKMLEAMHVGNVWKELYRKCKIHIYRIWNCGTEMTKVLESKTVCILRIVVLLDFTLRKRKSFANIIIHYHHPYRHKHNKSIQRPHTTAKKNLVWIGSPYPDPEFGLLPKFNLALPCPRAHLWWKSGHSLR